MAMTKNELLYGTDNVPVIPQSVIDARLKLLDANLTILLAEDYKTRDLSRIGKVYKALQFWRDINK